MIHMLRRVLLLFAAFNLSVNVTQSQHEISTLEPRIGIERELAGGQKHRYQISLTAGQFARVNIEQRGIDVVVRSFGNEGKQIAEFDSEFRSNGNEVVDLIAETAGVYRLEVAAKNQTDRAGRYEIRLAEVRVVTDGDRSLQEARNLLGESNRFLGETKLKEARELAERALVIREGVLEADHPDVANALHLLGTIAYQSDEYDQAESNFVRAVAMREKLLPPDHPDLADSLAGLALVYFVKGKYSKVKPLFDRAVEIKERAFGPDHPEVARTLHRLANTYFHSWDYAQAELIYTRCLTIYEKSYDANHPTIAKTLGNLANVYTQLGDYAKAEPILNRSIEIAEKLQGPDSPEVSSPLIMIGNLYSDMGQYSKAVDAYLRALSNLEKLAPRSFGTFVALSNLGNAYLRQGEYSKAEALLERSLKGMEELHGSEHPRVGRALNRLANLYRAQGDYTRAEPLYRRALEIIEKAWGSEHLDLVESLNGLAIIDRVKGDISQSVAHQTRLNAVLERNINYNLVIGSERQKLAYLDSLSEEADRTLSLHIQMAPDNPNARLLAATAVLQRKGRVLDWIADRLAVLRSHSGAEVRMQIEQLNDLSSQLATLVLRGPNDLPLTEHLQNIKTLEEQREKLENEISRTSDGFYQRSDPVTLSVLQTAIPSDASLIEFAIYRPFNPKASDIQKAFGAPRYVAYILQRQTEVQWKDLGEVEAIDQAIHDFRSALREPKGEDIKRQGRSVDERILQPIRALLGGTTHLLISPDGALNLIPFEALVDEQNRYLVERFSITYLTSGRDLLRMQVIRESKNEALLVANPMFGEPKSIAMAEVKAARPQNSFAKRRSVTTGSDLSQLYFAPLGGTAQEAKAIKTLFADASFLTGAQATESSLKRVLAPKIIHIATHGFFLTDTTKTNPKIANPLLRSGLALAGANIRNSNGDDGILTALEASGMNLWGTKLVTLSACDTGVGEVKNGEGVYGLRRSFVLAGAQTLVMSLWPVSDYVTRQMMTDYYSGLKKGLGRGEALRQTQLGMLKRKGREHPFYWASFIQSGEWANLNGTR